MTPVEHIAPLISFRHVRKTLAGRVLLNIDEFSLRAGGCVILTGRNGAGKTTLLKIMAGLERPDSAEVQYRGRTLPWRAARRRYRRDVVYLHQHPFVFDASVADNVAYALRYARLPREQIQARVSQALEWAGLEHLAGRHARRLSGGEKQRVALTRAWVLAPRVLLLDEPLASLDHESRERTYFLIERLKSSQIALVITGHDRQWLLALGDVHTHLHAGQIRRNGINSLADEPETVNETPNPVRSVTTCTGGQPDDHQDRLNQLN